MMTTKTRTIPTSPMTFWALVAPGRVCWYFPSRKLPLTMLPGVYGLPPFLSAEPSTSPNLSFSASFCSS